MSLNFLNTIYPSLPFIHYYPLHLASWHRAMSPKNLSFENTEMGCPLKRQKWDVKSSSKVVQIYIYIFFFGGGGRAARHCISDPNPHCWTSHLTSALVGKLTAEVWYLSSKNRLSCWFKGHFFTVPKMFSSHSRQKARRCFEKPNALTPLLLSCQLLIERPLKTHKNVRSKRKKAEHRWLQMAVERTFFWRVGDMAHSINWIEDTVFSCGIPIQCSSTEQ
jgi:hypothetical protein